MVAIGYVIRRVLARLLHPPGACCIACGALRTDDAAGRLCRACLQEIEAPLEPRCPVCGAAGWQMLCPQCALTAPPDAMRCYAPWEHTGAPKALVLSLKYGCVLEAAEALAGPMAAALADGPFDALVPVPLHPKRLRERGFNQARALCDAVGRLRSLPVVEALWRERYTRTQTRLNADKRISNVRGAFVCRMDVRGMRLVLVDDVRTTGATARNCAETLLRAGAESVTLLTATIARPGRDAAAG